MIDPEKLLRRRLEQACAGGDCVDRPVAGHGETALLISMALGRPPADSLDLRSTPWLEGLRLLASLGNKQQVESAANRLLNWRGREAHWLWQWKFQLTDRQARFDPGKYGWGWTEGTTSWVIPTAVAVIALAKAQEIAAVSGKEVTARIESGKAMLIDRSCPAGGWNAGNPVVYGVALKPHLDTTAIALMALQDRSDSPVFQSGLSWLVANTPWCPSPYSLAWALLALATLRHRKSSLAAVATQTRGVLLAALDPLPEDVTTLAVALQALSALEGENPFLVRQT